MFRRGKMRTKNFKRAFCLVLILLVVVGRMVWVDVGRAEEGKQAILEDMKKEEGPSSFEELAEERPGTAQKEKPSEKVEVRNEKSNLLTDFILPLLGLPLVPVGVGLHIIYLFISEGISIVVGR